MPMTKVKKMRLEAIGDLIAEKKSITSQAELVELLAEMGEVASSAEARGETAAALLHGELSRRRRHNSTNTWSTSQVADDLALVGACERALAALGG